MNRADRENERIAQVVRDARQLRVLATPRIDLWPGIAARLNFEPRAGVNRAWIHVAVLCIVLLGAAVTVIASRVESYRATHQPAPMSAAEIRRVLSNVTHMQSDHYKARALVLVVRDASNDSSLVRAIIAETRTMSSSADKGAVLRQLASHHAITRALRDEFVAAVNTISSKAERESLLALIR